MIRRFALCVLACLAMTNAQGAEWLNVMLPQPKQVEWREGVCRVGEVPEHVTIVDNLAGVPRCRDEAYRLVLNADAVEIVAETELGVLRARQTLEQLREGGADVPCCSILDWPEFSVRGWMQDLGRAYLPVDELKAEIRNLARFKINVFHWHLTEHLAWRLQSDIYPQLTSAESMQRFEGKFYTKTEVREIVDYAHAHGIMVVPEIDMPGHSDAFTRAMGFKMDSKEGMAALRELLAEAVETFGPKVTTYHIGTDETAFEIPDFAPSMAAYVRSLGKKVWAWNPGWVFKPGEIDAVHMWSYRGAKQEGAAAIDSRLHYANHYDTFGDVVALYNSKIYRCDNGDDGVLGTIIAFWHDTPRCEPIDLIKQNCFYPSILAAAERAWMGGGYEYFDDHGAILYDDDSPQTQAFTDFERRMVWHFDHSLADAQICYVAQSGARWYITDAFPNGGDLAKVFPPEKSAKKKYCFEGADYGVRSVRGSGIYLRHVWGEGMVKGFYKKPQPNSTAYARARVYSAKAQDVGMLIEFQNFSRSEGRITAPAQGDWDLRGSWIKVNGKKIAPPQWMEHPPHMLGNENCAVRPPVMVHLKKGWNDVLLKLPVGEFTTPEVRLVKWAFTVAFTTPDGRKTADVIYE